MIKKIITTSLILLFLSGSALPVLAADNTGTANATTQGLTIQQAMDMALQNSREVESAQVTVDRSEDIEKHAGYVFQGVMQPTGQGAAGNALFLNLMSSNVSWDMAKRNKTVTEDQLTYQTFGDYVSVIKSIESLDCAQKALDNARWDLNMATVGWRVGTVSSYDRDSAESNYKAKLNAYNATKTTLDNDYQALDKLLGLSASDRPVLAEKPGYTILDPNFSLDGAVNNGVDNNPQIANLNSQVDLAQIKVSVWNGSGDPLEAVEKDKTKAQLTLDDTKTTVRQMVRTLYNTVMGLEGKITAQEQLVKIDQDTLRVTRVKFDTGQATTQDLNKAELTLQQDTLTLNGYYYQHEQLKLALQKPWAYSGSGSGSSSN